MNKTKIFIVIDEANLMLMTDHLNQVMKFKSAKDAESEASNRLDVWTVFKVDFNHKFLHHEPNY